MHLPRGKTRCMHKRGCRLEGDLCEVGTPRLRRSRSRAQSQGMNQAVQEPQGVRLHPVVESIVDERDKDSVLVTPAPRDRVIVPGFGSSHAVQMAAMSFSRAGGRREHDVTCILDALGSRDDQVGTLACVIGHKN